MTFDQFVERIESKGIRVNYSTWEKLKQYWDVFQEQGLDELLIKQIDLCKDINIRSLIFENIHIYNAQCYRYVSESPLSICLLFKAENWLCYLNHCKNHNICLVRFHN